MMLVTGGAGFIGCNFVRSALSKGHDVTVIDKLTYAGSARNLSDVKSKIKFVNGDITKKSDVEKCTKEAETVVNFAAETHVDRSIKDAAPFLQTNIFGTYTLLEAARNSNVKTFVHISTDEVYGSSEKGKFVEEATLDPRNPYSATKAAAEHLVVSYFNTYGINTLITRSSNNYGPYQNTEKFVPKMITNTLQNKALPVYAGGLNMRDWIFVEDNCSAIHTVIESGKRGKVYNIGGGRERKNIDVAKAILKILGKPQSLIKFVPDRPGHDFRYALDIRKIKKLGWTPSHTFSEGLKKTIDWYIRNRWFWS